MYRHRRIIELCGGTLVDGKLSLIFQVPSGKAVNPKDNPAGATRTTRDHELSHKRVTETGSCSIGIRMGRGAASSSGAISVSLWRCGAAKLWRCSTNSCHVPPSLFASMQYTRCVIVAQCLF